MFGFGRTQRTGGAVNVLRRRVTLGLVSLCALAAALVFAIGSNAAGSPAQIPQIGSFGEKGTGGGQLRFPRGVAVDNSTGSSRGDVYVGDQTNQRVEKFGAGGNFILMFGDEVNKDGSDVCKAGEECQAGTKAAGAGQFGNPLGVAVDPTSGSVYVVDFSNHRVQKFSPEGQFELMFGGEVNNAKVEKRKEEEEKSEPVTVSKSEENICTAGETCQAGQIASESEEGEGKFHAWSAGSFIAVGQTGTVYVGDENRVQEFDQNGTYLKQVQLPGLGKVKTLAVNASGNIFVSAAIEAHSVHEYEPSGESATEVHEFLPDSFGSQSLASASPEALAIDPVTGDLYMAYKLAEENSIGALGECVVTEYESSAPYAAVAVTRPGLLAASEGLAFGRHGTLYAADSANTEAADKVLIFGEPPVEGLQGAPPPAINSTYVERDGSNSALLAAAINPHFVSGTYRVEYGRESSYGSVSATMPLVSVTEVAETFPLEGLQPETQYHYRFVVENESPGSTLRSRRDLRDVRGRAEHPPGRPCL